MPLGSIYFILGLLIGSFLNVVIYRVPKEMSIVKPRSSCGNCGHMIAAWENIPIVSYLILRGKCSQCGTAISLRYPLVELLTGLVFYQTYYFYQSNLASVTLLASYLAAVIAITFIDLEHYIIPNGLLIFMLIPVSGLIYLYEGRWLVALIGGLSLGAGFYLIRLIGNIVFKKESMGMGDVKYAILIGLLLGWKVGLVAVAISFVSASLYALALTPFKKIKMGMQVPFGPFMSLGIYGGVFWGTDILNWYMGYLFR